MGFIGKLKGFFLDFPREVRLGNHDVYASRTSFWFTVTSEKFERS